MNSATASRPNDCERFEIMLSSQLDNELDPESVRELETHVAACSRCRDRGNAFRTIDQSIACATHVTPRFRDSVLAAVQTVSVEKTTASNATPVIGRSMWGGLLAVAATIAIGLFLFQRVGEGSTDPALVADPLASLTLIDYQAEMNQRSMLETCRLEVRLLEAELGGYQLTEEQQRLFEEKIEMIMSRIQRLEQGDQIP